MKVRVAMVDLWQVVLRNSFQEFEKVMAKQGQEKREQRKKQMLSMNMNTTESSGEMVDPEDDEFVKLAECLDHVCRHLYRDAMDKAPLLKALHFMTRIFLESVPATVESPKLYLNLALLFMLTTA